jgi:ribose transport system ATP-binding protein
MSLGAGEVALSIESLSKTFGPITVLRDVHLDLAPGQIHGLLGENGSGKSTLIKVLSGYHEPDPGASVRLWGKPVEFPLRPGAARALGLNFVHQDLGLIPEISIVENLFVSEIASGKRTLTRRQMVQATQECLRRYSIDARPENPVAVLRLGDRALLAIARAFNEVFAAGINADSRRVLILDEPTAAMSLVEKKDLYRTFAALAKAGHALMLVSHDLDEIMEVTDIVTVLRDGEVVGTVKTASAMPDEIIRMIIGHNLSESGRRREREAGDVRLQARNMNSTALANVSFALRSGEVVGVAGLVGSGYAEVNQTLFGLEESATGEISVAGLKIDLKYHKPADAVGMGMGLVPAERDKAGVSLELSVTDNLTVQLLQPPDGSRRPWLSRGRLKKAAADAVARYRIKAPGLNALLKTLSGGNRQKVLLAKWLASGKSVLLLDEPTQGVDIGAHEEILNVVDQFARKGGVVLIASEDWDQLAEICDRVLIFAGGSVKAELKDNELSKHAIGEACYKWGSRLTRDGVAQSEATR